MEEQVERRFRDATQPVTTVEPSPGGQAGAAAVFVSTLGNAASASLLAAPASEAAPTASPSSPPARPGAGTARRSDDATSVGLARTVALRAIASTTPLPDARRPTGAAAADGCRSAGVATPPQLARATSGRALMRQQRVQELPTIEIVAGGESLAQTTSRHAEQAAEQWNEQLSFGASTVGTTDPRTGEFRPNRENAVVANAMQRGTLDDLRRLGEDVDTLRPVYLSWVRAQTTVNTIQTQAGIDPATPDTYAAEVAEMGRSLANMSTGNALGQQMRAALGQGQARVTSQTLTGATADLNNAMRDIQTTRRNLEQFKNRLEQARLQREIQQDEQKLTKIRETIQLISDIITKLASVAAAASGAAAAASAAAAAAEVGGGPERLGSLPPEPDVGPDAQPGRGSGPLIRSGPYGAIQSGAGRVAGAGGAISTILEQTVFARDIQEINERIGRAQTQVAELGQANLALDAANLRTALERANDTYRSAYSALTEARENFANAMRDVGRTWDQRGLTTQQAEDRGPEALAGRTPGRAGSEFSMEAVLSMLAALQARSSARGAVKTVVESAPRLRRAESIMIRSLSTGRTGLVPIPGVPQGVLADVPIDFVPSVPGDTNPQPSLGTRLSAAYFRRAVDIVATVIRVLDEQGPLQQADERGFLRMVTNATQRRIQ